QRAIAACVMGDLDYKHKVVWPWVCTQKHARGNGPRTEERGIEWLQDKWNGFTDNCVGPNHVYWWAARCGYESRDEKAQELFDAIADPTGDAAAEGGQQADGFGAGTASRSLGLGTGSNGPTAQFDRHRPLAIGLASQLRPAWRYNVDSRTWYHH